MNFLYALLVVVDTMTSVMLCLWLLSSELKFQSARENRQLSKQLETWKQQLSSFDASSSGAAILDTDDDDDDETSPAVFRMRQEQAYRSVASLQLRVEELTLEVTKVSGLSIL